MFKRGILYFLLIIPLVSCVYALHSVSVNIEPNSSYENVDSYFDLEIKNEIGSNIINNITLDLVGYNIINVSSSVPNYTNTNTSINWYSVIYPEWTAHFFFWAKADLVDSDTVYNWDITTYDDNFGININSVNITALNDTVGPEISTSVKDYIFRGENITINATVSDINGIEDVYADINLPNGTIDRIDLSLENEIYIANYITNNGYPEGIYTIDVYATDGAGNINSNNTNINVESYYTILISLSNVNPSNGETVNINGNIKYDNESNTDNVNVSVSYPNDLSYILSSNGTFLLSFTASSEGYVYANATNYNNRNFGSNVISMTIYTPSSGGGSSGGGHSSNDIVIEEPEQPIQNSTSITVIKPEKPSIENPVEEKPEETNSNNKITGFAIINILRSKPIMALIILIIVVLLSFGIYRFIFKKKKETYGF